MGETGRACKAEGVGGRIKVSFNDRIDTRRDGDRGGLPQRKHKFTVMKRSRSFERIQLQIRVEILLKACLVELVKPLHFLKPGRKRILTTIPKDRLLERNPTLLCDLIFSLCLCGRKNARTTKQLAAAGCEAKAAAGCTQSMPNRFQFHQPRFATLCDHPAYRTLKFSRQLLHRTAFSSLQGFGRTAILIFS